MALNTHEWAVGDTVVIRDVSDRGRGPRTGTVTKVSRVLFTVAFDDKWATEIVCRKDTGRANDNYGHTWVVTTDQYADESVREALTLRLRAHGTHIDQSWRYSTETIAAIADLLDADQMP